MKTKESLIKTEKEAKELSIKNKDTVYYVIDKKRSVPLCYSLDWLAFRKIKYDGYFPVCTYLNGTRR